jgi:tRNA(Ile)-lysidine synthase TilS/MesJ
MQATRHIFHRAGKAVMEYDMILPEDKIAIGVSGGKDSMALLAALAHLRRVAPIDFSLLAIHIGMGWKEDPSGSAIMSDYCHSLDIPFLVETTDIAKIIFEIRQEENPCSLCARMRSGALHNTANREGCNVVALGHHGDDAIESLLMSITQEGRVRTFAPVTQLTRKNLRLIRPLILAFEAEVIAMVAEGQIPVFKTPCPASGLTARNRAKDIIDQMEAESPGTRQRILRSLSKQPRLW